MRVLVMALVFLLTTAPVAYPNPDIPVRGSLEVWNIMEHELGAITQHVDMPQMEVVIRDWSRYRGWVSFPSEKPTVYLWDRYDSYDLAHFVAAHEFGHVWLAHTGRPNTEELADLFATCFGSLSAQRYGRSVHGVTGECEHLGLAD